MRQATLMAMKTMTTPKGFALVLVLWVLTLLAIMAGSFSVSMRRETAIIRGIKDNAQALALAEAGLAIAQMRLLEKDSALRWRANGSIYQLDFPEGRAGEPGAVRIKMLAEAGKIDINQADQILLQSLMSHAPADAELQSKLVNAILDWRDDDDLVRIDGAEAKEYAEAGLNYKPTNKPFKTIEDLQRVLNMNAQVYQWLEDLVTVHSGQKQVDANLASREVLQVLPETDAGAVDTLLSNRQAQTQTQNLPSASGLPINPVAAAPDQAAAAGSSQSQAITVIVEAQLERNGEDENPAGAVIKVLLKQSEEEQGEPFQVLKWQRNPANGLSLFGNAALDGTDKDELLTARYAEPEFNN